MIKRAFDLLVSLAGLALLAPLLVLIAAAIWCGSRGPLFYRARRVGRNGKEFLMLKFRTMVVNADSGSSITAPQDRRVFPLGAFLRRFKLDELPQLFDVLRGEMSIVGPRPEDPRIVAEHYSPQGRETLRVRPGLTSPGSLWYYSEGESLLEPNDPERSYVLDVLPVKLEIDRAYLSRATLATDLGVIARTLLTILHLLTRRTASASVPPRRSPAHL